MKISKKIAKKAIEYEKSKIRTDRLFEKLSKWAHENDFDGYRIHGFGIVEFPSGEKQEGGEYLDQKSSEDGCVRGMCYYPIKGSKKYYMWVSYSSWMKFKIKSGYFQNGNTKN